jgi:RNA polymerase sigma-70 factor (ECF subfamily)
MLRVQSGSESAFEELYERYFRRLAYFFHGMSRDPQLSEDLCHETFIRIWQLRARYSPAGSFPGFAYAVARLIWLEHCRHSRRQPRPAPANTFESQEEPVVRADTPGPFELACRAEVDERVFAALDKLPEDQRMAFILRTVNGLPLEEIAEVMQCPVNTVRSRKLLAIRRLRQLLGNFFRPNDIE